jgi:hypothetical protein
MAEINLPKEGSKWSGSSHVIFHVLHTIELDGHTWVHYRDDQREYSCYLESFLQRFKELAE